MSALWVFAAAVAAGAAVYFLVVGVFLGRTYASGMTRTERAQALIDEAKEAENRGSWSERLIRSLRRRGYTGDPLPVLIIGALTYVVIVGASRAIGLPVLAAVAVAVPAGIGVAVMVLRNMELRRRRAFNKQLIGALQQVAAQLESSAGLKQSFERVTPNLAQPLRGEFERALVAAEVVDFVQAMEPIRDKYPSRAMDLLIASLTLTASTGAAVAPAMREASDVLQRDAELNDEATAEISQVRGEFFIIVGIIGFICISVVSGADENLQRNILSTVGLILLIPFVVNFGIGIKRALNMFARARGDRS